MDHAGDTARIIAESYILSQGERARAGFLDGGTYDEWTLIVWNREGLPFRVTVEALDVSEMTEAELYPRAAAEMIPR